MTTGANCPQLKAIPMSDRRLQVFHRVAQALSFTRAAVSLGMSQPAVTFQVRQLEDDLGTRLFDRSHNRISLTPAGRSVFEHAERIFSLYAEMEQSVQALTGENRGTLTIGASTTIAEYMLPALLGDFRQAYPEVNIRLRVSNTEGVVASVADSSLDLGIVEGAVDNKQLTVEACRVDRLVVVLPNKHPLSDEAALTLQQLLPFPFIFRESGSGTRSVFAQYLREQGYEEADLDNALELGSTEAIKGAVQAGMGLSVVSEATVEKELALGLLRAIPLQPALTRDFSFVRQRQKFRSRLAESLFEFARHYCRSIMP
jgi:DNA-binding transcriptional LysR family regulator